MPVRFSATQLTVQFFLAPSIKPTCRRNMSVKLGTSGRTNNTIIVGCRCWSAGYSCRAIYELNGNAYGARARVPPSPRPPHCNALTRLALFRLHCFLRSCIVSVTIMVSRELRATSIATRCLGITPRVRPPADCVAAATRPINPMSPAP